MANFDRRRHGTSLESQGAGIVLPQRRQDDGCGRFDAAEFFGRKTAECFFKGTTCTAASIPDYDVSPDGQRFLMVKAGQEQAAAQINVVLNWFEELKQKVPTGKK